MGESKDLRVEHRALRDDPWVGIVADIYTFADEGMTKLGKMDANLVLPAGFEAALDPCRTRERGDRPYVRNRMPRT